MKKLIQRCSKKIISTITVVALILSLISSGLLFNAVAFSEMLTNGGFEDGTTTGFSLRAGIAGVTSVVSDVHHTGNYSAKISGVAQTGLSNRSIFVNNIVVETNTNYEWTFYTKFIEGTQAFVAVKDASVNTIFEGTAKTDISVTVENGTVNGPSSGFFIINKGTASDWQKVTVKFNSGNLTKIAIGVSNYNAAVLYLDDWSLTKIENDTELINNGDFEHGNTSGFEVRAGISSKTSVASDNVKYGKYCLGINGYASQGYQNDSVHTQPITVEKNTNYIWTFLVKYTSGNKGYIAIKDASTNSTFGGSSLDVSKDDVKVENGFTNTPTSGYVGINVGNSEWQTITVKFNSGEHEKISLGYSNREGATVYLDNWSLKKFYTVSIKSSKNGNVSGPTFVIDGESADFTIVPNQDSELVVFQVNGTDMLSNVLDGKYHIGSVDGNIDIIASFKNSSESSGENFGFENANIDGFTYNSGLSGRYSIDSTEVHEGDYSLKISSDGTTKKVWTNNTFYREVSVEKNTNYRWTFWLKISEGLSNASGYTAGFKVTQAASHFDGKAINADFVDVSYGGMISAAPADANFYPIYFSTTDWCKYTLEFNSGDCDKISVGYSSIYGGTTSYTDDWQIIKVEETTDDALLKNGGFESGNIKGFGYNSGLKGKVSISDKVMHSGNYSAYIDAVGNKSWTANSIYQTVDVTPNTHYKWTFWLKLVDVGNKSTAATLWIKDGNPAGTNMIYADGVGVTKGGNVLSSTTNGFYSINFKDDNWYQYTVTFNSGENEKITLGYSSTISETKSYLDDWELVVDNDWVPPVEAGVGEIVNSGFETGNTQNWYFRNGASTASEVQFKEKHSGEYALKIGPIGNTAFTNNTVYQKVKVQKNSIYRWTLWVKIETSEKSGVRVAGLSTRMGDNAFVSSLLDSKNGKIQQQDSNTNGYGGIIWNGSTDWIQYTVTFISGENEEVQLTYSNQNAQLISYIDDFEIERLGDAPKSTTTDKLLIDNDFEDVLENGYSVTAGAETMWSKSSESAHSGKYSMKYNGSNTLGYLGLYWTDCFGNNGYTVELKPNTTYRYSFWYRVSSDYGKAKTSSCAVMQYTGEMSSNQYMKYIPNDTTWQYVEYIFTTPSGNTPIKKAFRLASGYHKRPEMDLYVDDIKVEEVEPEILSDNLDKSYCEEYFNLITNGSFESDTFSDDWIGLPIERFRNTISDKDPGYYSARLNGTLNYSKSISLKGGSTYEFAFSYKGSSNNVLIGIYADGKIMKPAKMSDAKSSSMISLEDTDSKWKRCSFVFVAPTSGKVTLVINGEANDLEIDDICLFKSNLGYEYNPNEYIPDENVLKELSIKTQGESNSKENHKADEISQDDNDGILYVVTAIIVVILIVCVAFAIIFIKKKRRFSK